MRVLEFSEDTITVYIDGLSQLETNQKLVFILDTLKSKDLDGVIDYALSYHSLVVYYLPHIIDVNVIRDELIEAEKSYKSSVSNQKTIIEIPVCYDSEFGLDQKRFNDAGVDMEELIALHTEKEYLIHMIGFLPGFPYLDGVNERLKMHRLSTPRTKIPSGSVGIAGSQTGLYPTSSPGGWNIIGRTPLAIGIEENTLNVPYSVGDYIKFVPIDRTEFDEITSQINNKNYKINIYERGV